MTSVHYLGSACVEPLSNECLCVGAACGHELKPGQVFARAPLLEWDILKEVSRFFLPIRHCGLSINNLFASLRTHKQLMGYYSPTRDVADKRSSQSSLLPMFGIRFRLDIP
jgi:hypothetical protein